MHLKWNGGGFGRNAVKAESRETIHRSPRYRMEPVGQPRNYCDYEPREHQRVCLEHECAISPMGEDSDRCVCPRGHECRPGSWLVVRVHEGGRQGVVWSPDADEGRLC